MATNNPNDPLDEDIPNSRLHLSLDRSKAHKNVTDTPLPSSAPKQVLIPGIRKPITPDPREVNIPKAEPKDSTQATFDSQENEQASWGSQRHESFQVNQSQRESDLKGINDRIAEVRRSSRRRRQPGSHAFTGPAIPSNIRGDNHTGETADPDMEMETRSKAVGRSSGVNIEDNRRDSSSSSGSSSSRDNNASIPPGSQWSASDKPSSTSSLYDFMDTGVPGNKGSYGSVSNQQASMSRHTEKTFLIPRTLSPTPLRTSLDAMEEIAEIPAFLDTHKDFRYPEPGQEEIGSPGSYCSRPFVHSLGLDTESEPVEGIAPTSTKPHPSLLEMGNESPTSAHNRALQTLMNLLGPIITRLSKEIIFTGLSEDSVISISLKTMNELPNDLIERLSSRTVLALANGTIQRLSPSTLKTKAVLLEGLHRGIENLAGELKNQDLAESTMEYVAMISLKRATLRSLVLAYNPGSKKVDAAIPFQRIKFAHDVWNLNLTSDVKSSVTSLPLMIAHHPVIVNHTTIGAGAYNSPPDPVPDLVIDPRKDVGDGVLDQLFRTYPNATAAIFYLNHTILLLYHYLDREYELNERPHHFARFQVTHQEFNRNYTSGKRLQSARGPRVTSKEHPTHVGFRVRVSYKPQIVGPLNDHESWVDWALRKVLGRDMDIPHRKDLERSGFKVADRGSVMLGIRIRSNENNPEPDIEAVTTTVHGLGSVISIGPDLPDDPSHISALPLNNPEWFEFTNPTTGRKFGSFSIHYEGEDNELFYRDGKKRNLVTYKHDLALVTGTAEELPYLIFKGEDEKPIRMVWMEPDDLDFLKNPIYLLGFDPQLQRSRNMTRSPSNASTETRSVQTRPLIGGIIRAPGEFGARTGDDRLPRPKRENQNFSEPNAAKRTKFSDDNEHLGVYYDSTQSVTYSDAEGEDPEISQNLPESDSSSTDWMPGPFRSKPLSGVTMGKMYERQIKENRDRIRRSYTNASTDSERLRNFYTRSWIWRADTDKERIALKTLSGHSGCALALKVEMDGKPVYKIFAFQNAEVGIGNGEELSSIPEDDAIDTELMNHFPTYQAFCLPEELMKTWDIVWDPNAPTKEKFEVSPISAEMSVLTNRVPTSVPTQALNALQTLFYPRKELSAVTVGI